MRSGPSYGAARPWMPLALTLGLHLLLVLAWLTLGHDRPKRPSLSRLCPHRQRQPPRHPLPFPNRPVKRKPDAPGSPLPGDLRKGSSPITAAPERKWERLADAFAAARASQPPGLTLESTTAPDGVTIYRKTVAGRTRCYRSGSVGGLVTGFGNADGHGAGRTTCPPTLPGPAAESALLR